MLMELDKRMDSESLERCRQVRRKGTVLCSNLVEGQVPEGQSVGG